MKPSSLKLKYLPNFVQTHEEWCKAVTSTYRARKRKDWKTFKEELFYEPFALTLPGIVIWARCYHRHVAFIYNYGYWTTHYKHDLSQCHVFLLYRGNNVFDDTRMISSTEYKMRNKEITLTCRKIDRFMNRRRLQLRKEREAEEQMTTSSSSSANNNEDQEADREVPNKTGESDVDLEEMLEKSLDNSEQNDAEQTVDNTDDANTNKTETDLNNVQNDAAQTVDNIDAANTNKTETDLNNVQNDAAQTVDNIDAANTNKTETETKEQESESMQTDDSDEAKKKPKSTGAKDNRNQEEENMETCTRSIVTRSSANKSVEGNVHNVQKDTVMPRKPIVTRSTANKAASKLIHKAKIKIKGSWEFVNNERAECAKLTKCYLCGAQKDTLRALESHIRRKHKSYRYKCKYCKKKYLTRAGRNKHEMYHTVGYRFRCKDCNKRFLFASQYEEHRSVHTGENRYICRKKGCRKHYGSTRARNYHERQHNAKAMYCDFRETPTSKKCNQEFYSRQHLQQHYQGLHGDGWNAKCGKNYSWPAQRTAHEKECTACGKN